MMDRDRGAEFLGRLSMTAELPKPDYTRTTMRILAHCDQGRQARRRADHGASRPRLYRPHVSPKASASSTCAMPNAPRAVNYPRRAAEHLEHPPADPRRSAARRQRQGHVRGRGVRRREGLLQGPTRQRGRHGGEDKRGARLDRRARGLRHFHAGDAAAHRLHADRGRRHSPPSGTPAAAGAYVSALLDGFTDYILLTVGPWAIRRIRVSAGAIGSPA